MNKTLTRLTLAATLAAPQLASAEFISVYAGAEGWRLDPTASFGANQQQSAAFDFSDETASNFYIGLEHPIPLIPNIKIRKDSIDIGGQTTLTSNFTLNGKTYNVNDRIDSAIKLEQTDVILYWELLDLDLFSFDFGINAKYIDTDLAANDGTTLTTDNFKGWVPMAYVAAEVSFPGLPISLWTEGSYASYSDDRFYDARAAVKYTLVETLPMDLTVSVGYRALEVDIDDLDDVFADIDFTGYYAGVELRF